MSLGLNLNGLETIITLAMANDETNTDPEKLIYDVENIYFGTEEEGFDVSDETRASIRNSCRNDSRWCIYIL